MPPGPDMTNGARPPREGRRGRRRRSYLSAGGACATALAVALLEPVDPAADVHDLLLAGVERVAGRADLGVHLTALAVLRVVNVLPQEQVTWVTT